MGFTPRTRGKYVPVRSYAASLRHMVLESESHPVPFDVDRNLKHKFSLNIGAYTPR